ncbi:MAG: helix-turn-helix domain-containing protein [Halobacteriota archaeon]
MKSLIKRLTCFNLTEKEARCYLYLLTAGPKQPGELKKPLKIYREGVHRVLTSLMDKGMISRIANGTSKYSAVELPTALDTQLLIYKREMQQLDDIRRALDNHLHGHHFIIAGDGLTYKLPNSIDDHDALIAALTRFNLTEKEARCYLYLLTHGPQHPTSLMRALKTYREDIYRRCTSLMNKSMLYKSAAEPSLYVASELDPALERFMACREDEFHGLTAMKEELEGLVICKPPVKTGDTYTFKILKTLREVIAVTTQLVRSAKADLAFIAPPRILDLFSMTGVLDEYAKVINQGVHVRGITDITPRNQRAAREHVEVGMHLRHLDQYRGITGVIVDGKQSISVIHADLNMRISSDTSVTMLWSDSPEQASYLMNTFELIWNQATDVEERIRELSEDKRTPIETTVSAY